MTTPPIALAWASVAAWASRNGAIEIDKLEQNWRGETDQWEVECNGSNEQRNDIPPKGIMLTHKKKFALAILGPFDGTIAGGLSEDEILTHFGDPREAVEMAETETAKRRAALARMAKDDFDNGEI